jgi:hypothetical protein
MIEQFLETISGQKQHQFKTKRLTEENRGYKEAQTFVRYSEIRVLDSDPEKEEVFNGFSW